MPKPNQPFNPKPWLTVYKADYRGAFPTRLECGVCRTHYRPQSIVTAARWLREHRLHRKEEWLKPTVKHHVIVPHPATPTSTETFLAMVMENFSKAESVVVSIVDETGTHRAFCTRMRNSDLAFHKHCVDVYLAGVIERSDS